MARIRMLMNHDLIHKELSDSIIGAAMSVLNSLKPGLDEKLSKYHRSETRPALELQKCQTRVETRGALISSVPSV